MNHNIEEEDILAMKVPKYNQTQFNTGIAMFHLRSAEAVASALMLKGTYIGDRWVPERGRERERGKPKAREVVGMFFFLRAHTSPRVARIGNV